jgi:hypothetical protein
MDSENKAKIYIHRSETVQRRVCSSKNTSNLSHQEKTIQGLMRIQKDWLSLCKYRSCFSEFSYNLLMKMTQLRFLGTMPRNTDDQQEAWI